MRRSGRERGLHASDCIPAGAQGSYRRATMSGGIGGAMSARGTEAEKPSAGAYIAWLVASSVEAMAYFGRWLAAACAVGTALSMSVMFSSYTSLTSVSPEQICVASQFVSRTMRGGRMTALDFMEAGLLALVAASFPKAASAWSNLKLPRDDIKPVQFRDSTSTFSGARLTIFTVVFQLFPLLIGTGFFCAALHRVFGPNLPLSPEAIQSMWQEFKAACGK
jgi:hypothetical protein